MDKSARTAIWKGLNRMPYIGDGEMRSMKNLSSDAYPFITTRKGRKPYTFTTYIPSPEGEAYKDIDVLPEPCEAELGNIYKVTADAAKTGYVSGSFYYWDGSTWVEGKLASELYGVTSTVKDRCLISGSYYECSTTNARYPGYKGGTIGSCEYYPSVYWENSKLTTSYTKGSSTYYEYKGCRVKYLGKTTENFVKGKTYAYTMYVTAYFAEGTWSSGNSGGTVEELPIASASLARSRWYYKYNDTWYKCVVDSYCEWVECEEQYTTVEEMPTAPTENQLVRYINTMYAAPTKSQYYLCEVESKSSGELVYFYTTASSATEYTTVGYISKASAENEGKYFYYTGPTTAGEFAECYYNESFYDWKVVEHPKVSRTVTLEDYLDNYDGCGLGEILEIGTLKNDIAALIVDSEGNTLLYYDQKLWNTGGLSSKSGKKLITVGNKLVVGEAGSYLYIKDGAKEFFKSGEAFAQSITATYASYGNGGEKAVWSSAWGKAGGSATFKIVAPGGQGTGFKTVYEGLSVSGTDFKVEFNGKTYYLTVSNVSYEENVLIQKWTTGSTWYYDYADRLTITASNCSDDFDWDNTGTGFSKDFFFESTDPHYYDVVAWKKRLWGYDENVMFGTAADIFDENGIVDWNRGDNTNLEAISQPLWQGSDITGIAALMSGLVYFKRDCITVVTGNYPAVMNSDTIPCRGLPPENRRSVAVGNECVYYLSNDGVYRFDGGIPYCISRDAKISGTNAIGASDGNKYWLSLKEDSGEYALYVYDINRQIWHKEDNTHVISFTMLDGEMYMAVGTEIYNISTPQEDVDWECELWYDEGTHKKKRYKEFHMRGNVGQCEFFLKADEGEWMLIAASEGQFSIKIPPFECEELSVLIKGRGICEIKSLDRVFEVDG